MNRRGLGRGCPSGETLSAFLDGEVPAPWDRELAAHVQGCPLCLEALSRFRRLRDVLGSDPLPESNPPPLRQAQRPRPVPVWKRRIALPVPVAAAAAAAILALGVALAAVAGRATLPWMSIRREPTGTTEVIVAAPVENLEQLLRTLDQQPQSSGLVIRLPADSQLMMMGEPQLVREADYSRGRR